MHTPSPPSGNGLTLPLDQAQFNRLYEQTFDAVYEHLLAEVSNTRRAEDLTVAVYVQAWKSREQLDRTIDLLPWLLMMASVLVIADPADIDSLANRSDLLPKSP